MFLSIHHVHCVKTVKDSRSEQEMIEGLRYRLTESIRLRLRADVKVGVSLSGGLDSSIVAGMVNNLIKEGQKIGSDAVTERLSCFGIAFDEESGLDESSLLPLLNFRKVTDDYSAIANRTAQHLGVRFHKKHMNEESLADQFEGATWHCEQPFADLNFIGTYALSELVRGQGFRVLLNGTFALNAGESILIVSRPRQRRDSGRLFPLPTRLPPRSRPHLLWSDNHRAESRKVPSRYQEIGSPFYVNQTVHPYHLPSSLPTVQ